MGRIGLSILLIGLINLYNIIKYGVIINIPTIDYTIAPILDVEILNSGKGGEELIKIGINEIKLIIIMITLLYFILPNSTENFWNSKIKSFITKRGYIEYELLVGLGIIGIIILIISKDLIMLYLGLELYNFTTYILIFSPIGLETLAIRRMSIIYLILSSISSGLLLLAFFLLYKSYGTLNYDSLSNLINLQSNELITSSLQNYSTSYQGWVEPIINLISSYYLLLITISIIFKLGAIPFFFWLLRLYTDLDKKILIYQLTVPKLFFFIIYLNLLYLGLNSLPSVHISTSGLPEVLTGGSYYFIYLLFIISFLSIIIGAIGGLFQNKDSNLLSYSSLLNLGFILFSFSIILLSTPQELKSFLGFTNKDFIIGHIKEILWVIFQYFYIYFINLLGLFSIFSLYIRSSNIYLFKSFAYYPFFFISFFIIILSFIGIPPFSGFFAKFFLFFTLFNNLSDSFSLLFVFIFICFTLISSFFYFKFLFSSSIQSLPLNSPLFFNHNLFLNTKLVTFDQLTLKNLSPATILQTHPWDESKLVHTVDINSFSKTKHVEFFSLLLSFSTLFSIFYPYFLSSLFPYYFSF